MNLGHPYKNVAKMKWYIYLNGDERGMTRRKIEVKKQIKMCSVWKEVKRFSFENITVLHTCALSTFNFNLIQTIAPTNFPSEKIFTFVILPHTHIFFCLYFNQPVFTWVIVIKQQCSTSTYYIPVSKFVPLPAQIIYRLELEYVIKSCLCWTHRKIKYHIKIRMKLLVCILYVI